MRRLHHSDARSILCCAAFCMPALTQASGVPTATQWLEEVVVTGKLERLGGEPLSATAGS